MLNELQQFLQDKAPQNLKIFKPQYLSEILRYGPDFVHVCTYVNWKTFRYIFRGGHIAPPHLVENLKRRR